MQCFFPPLTEAFLAIYRLYKYFISRVCVCVNERTKLHFRADNFTTNKDISTAESVCNAP